MYEKRQRKLRKAIEIDIKSVDNFLTILLQQADSDGLKYFQN
jgi:hypothetical protein